MSTTSPPPSFPFAYFLHSDLASPKVLQSVLAASHLLKLRKAWLPGHSIGINGSVLPSGFGFGEWQTQDEIQGILLYVSCQEEEDRLRQHIGEVEVKRVEMEISIGGIWGKRKWIAGRAFVSKEEEQSVRRIENITTNNSVPGSSKLTRMALLRRITEPLRSRALVLEYGFEQASLKTEPAETATSTKDTTAQMGPRTERIPLVRRHTDFVTAPLRVVDDGCARVDRTSDDNSNDSTEETTQHGTDVDTKSPEHQSPCCSTDPNISASALSLVIEDSYEASSTQFTAGPSVLNSTTKEDDLEMKAQNDDSNKSNPSTCNTLTRQRSFIKLPESRDHQKALESNEGSPSSVPSSSAHKEHCLFSEAELEITVHKRASWNPWELLQRLQSKPTNPNEDRAVQQKNEANEKVDEQKGGIGVRGLVAMYETLKK